jgi:hemolysin activation/secretion protein
MKYLLIIALALLAFMHQTAMGQTETVTTPAFEVNEFVVVGNTLLPSSVVEQAVMPYMGPGRRFADLEQARAALEKAYQDAGYLSVVVNLPTNQRVDQKEVRLEVMQAPLEKLSVSGAKYHLPSRIQAVIPSLRMGEVPNFPQVQREMAAMQTANLQATPLINASDSGTGIEVDLKVEDKLPLSASIELNNGQSFNSSRGRVSASVTASNLFQRGHSFGMNWQYAPYRPKDSNTLSFIYSLPLSGRDSLLASLTNSSSDTPSQVSGSGPTSTITKGTFFGLRWSRTLDALSWPIRHSVYAAVDYKNNRDFNAFLNGSIVSRPPTRYPLLSTGYNITYNKGDDVVYTLSTAVKGSTHALAGRKVNCDGTVQEQFDCKRAGTSADFLAWQIGLGHGRPVFGQWRINLSADMQMASGQLPSGEQYSLGGPSTVRGYYDFEQSGDEGWSARAELVTPVFFNMESMKATALGFADRGLVKLINPQVSQIARTHLGSQGLGLRLSNGEGGFELGMDLARVVFDTVRPIDSGATEYASGAKANRRYRLDLNVRQSF